MSKIGRILFIAALALSTAACVGSQDTRDSAQMNDQLAQIAGSQPMPAIAWSQDRENLIQIYKMRQDARNTWTVVYAMGSSIPIFDCPSIGMPIPADTQLTNPLKPYWSNSGGSSSAVVEQAEPNGLFTSKNTDGTYVVCVSATGARYPLYTEGKITTWPFPVKVDYSTGRVSPAGDPSMVISPSTGETPATPSTK